MEEEEGVGDGQEEGEEGGGGRGRGGGRVGEGGGRGDGGGGRGDGGRGGGGGRDGGEMDFRPSSPPPRYSSPQSGPPPHPIQTRYMSPLMQQQTQPHPSQTFQSFRFGSPGHGSPPTGGIRHLSPPPSGRYVSPSRQMRGFSPGFSPSFERDQQQYGGRPPAQQHFPPPFTRYEDRGEQH